MNTDIPLGAAAALRRPAWHTGVQVPAVPAALGAGLAIVAAWALVTVLVPRSYKDPRDPSKCYSTTWFDTWRFVDGKADEHWDPATVAPPPSPMPCPTGR